MCGLIYSSAAERSQRIVSANMARAGRNKGAFTYTAVVQALGVPVPGETATVDPSAVGLLGPGVFHLQAPTCEESLPHPASHRNTLLWHNGIIKPEGCEMLRNDSEVYHNPDESWDTQLLVNYLAAHPMHTDEAMEMLSNLPGSFACILAYDGMLLAFRNAISPLFTNGEDLSSVRVDSAYASIEPGRILTHAMGGWIATSRKFICKHNPYDL